MDIQQSNKLGSASPIYCAQHTCIYIHIKTREPLDKNMRITCHTYIIKSILWIHFDTYCCCCLCLMAYFWLVVSNVGFYHQLEPTVVSILYNSFTRSKITKETHCVASLFPICICGAQYILSTCLLIKQTWIIVYWSVEVIRMLRSHVKLDFLSYYVMSFTWR